MIVCISRQMLWNVTEAWRKDIMYECLLAAPMTQFTATVTKISSVASIVELVALRFIITFD